MKGFNGGHGVSLMVLTLMYIRDIYIVLYSGVPVLDTCRWDELNDREM